MPVHESDVCIIGGGITSAMLAQKLAELRPALHITVERHHTRWCAHLPAVWRHRTTHVPLRASSNA